VCRGQTLQPEDLPPEVLIAGAARPEPWSGRPPTPFARPLVASAPAPTQAPTDARLDRDRVRAELEAHRWNRAETAQALGVSRSTLWRRMRELGLARRASYDVAR
jgi:transcriptional regulator of acetoin/glycerol metabolism